MTRGNAWAHPTQAWPPLNTGTVVVAVVAVEAVVAVGVGAVVEGELVVEGGLAVLLAVAGGVGWLAVVALAAGGRGGS